MFLFDIPVINQTMLHCGDFRANPQMEEYPSLWNNKIDKVYLDTTYCKPEYDFPSQEDAIFTAKELIRLHLKTYPKTLIVCGTYTIGESYTI
jgi:DNA cross-link repair 1A protein